MCVMNESLCVCVRVCDKKRRGREIDNGAGVSKALAKMCHGLRRERKR